MLQQDSSITASADLPSMVEIKSHYKYCTKIFSKKFINSQLVNKLHIRLCCAVFNQLYFTVYHFQYGPLNQNSTLLATTN